MARPAGRRKLKIASVADGPCASKASPKRLNDTDLHLGRHATPAIGIAVVGIERLTAGVTQCSFTPKASGLIEHWITVIAGWVRTWVEAQDWLDSVAPLIAATPDWAMAASAPVVGLVALGLAIAAVRKIVKAARDGTKALLNPTGVAQEIFDPPEYAKAVDFEAFSNVSDARQDAQAAQIARLQKQMLEMQEKLAAQFGRAAPNEEDRVRIAAAVTEIVNDPTEAARQAVGRIEAGEVTEGLQLLKADAQQLALVAQRDVVAKQAAAEAKSASRRFYQLGQLSRGIEPNEALEAFRNAVKFDPTLYAVRLDIARILRKLGRFDEAQRELEEVIEELGDNHPALSAEAWTVLGQILARKRATWSKALSAHRTAEKIRRRGKDSSGWAFNLGAIGDIYLRQGKLQRALDHHQQAAAIPRPAELRTYNSWRIGQILYRLGRINESQQTFLKAIELARSARRKDFVLKATDGLAQTFRLKGDWKRANDGFMSGLKYARTAEDKVRMLTGLGLVDVDRGETAEADKHFAAAIDAAEKAPRKLPHNFQDAHRAMIAVANGSVGNAASSLATIAQHYRNTGEDERLAVVEVMLARAEALRRRPDEARRHIAIARPILAQHAPVDSSDVDLALVEVLIVEGKRAQARALLEASAARIRQMQAWGRLDRVKALRRELAPKSRARAGTGARAPNTT